MSFSFAYVQSPENTLVKSYDVQGSLIDEQTIATQELDSESPKVVFLDKDLPDEFAQSFINEKTHLFPVCPREYEAPILEANQSKDLYQKLFNQWLLSHNLTAIEELTNIQQHLKTLWHTDPNQFVPQLWQFIKNNLAPQSLLIIYHDLAEPEKDNERGKLVAKKYSGQSEDEDFAANLAEEQLLNEYQTSGLKLLEVSEFDPKKNELVFQASIDKSPLLLLAKSSRPSALQYSILKGLFKGLQSQA